MKNIKLFLIPSIVITLLVGSTAFVTAAPPAQPSSFYGEIHYMTGDGGPIAGGTVEAYVPGAAIPVATAVIETFDSALVYAIKVPGDDPDTTGIVEGGTEGGLVTFKIDSRVVATGTWHMGTNVNIVFHPPMADAGGPYVTMVDETVSLSGSATDWLDTTFDYAWDLDNDGAYDDSTLQNPDHTFTTTGTKTVGLQVTDSQGGVGTATAEVVVVDISGLTGQVYDGTGKSVTVSGVTGFYSYDVTYDGLGTLPVNAGSYAVAVKVYNGATLLQTINKTMVIDKKAASVTPNAASKTYGDSEPTFSGILTGFIEADGVEATYSRTAGETVLGSPYTISAELVATTGDLNNYTVTYNTAEFTINPKAASVTVNAASKIYGEDDPTFGGTLDGFLVADNVSATYARESGETVAGSPYTISATLVAAEGVLSNYTVTNTSADFTINLRPITVTADDKSKVVGASDPALTYTVTSGSTAFDDAFTGNLVRDAGEIVGTYPIRQGTLALNANYDLTFINGTFTITGLTRSVDLAAGWNLVSLNIQPTNTTVESVLASIDGSYDLVYGWDASGASSESGNWLIYDPANTTGTNTLTALTRSMGFWIKMNQADTLEINGEYNATTAINLSTSASGWNLVGFPSSTSVDPAVSFDGITALSLIFEYDASTPANPWKVYDPSAPAFVSDLDLMRPDFGYWVFVTDTATWNVAY